MNKPNNLFLFLFCLIPCGVMAQMVVTKTAGQVVHQTFKEAQPYGKVDMDDLLLKSCDFEPDANAEILFDSGDIIVSSVRSMTRHIRMKIFNDFGKKYGTVKLLYHTEFLAGKAYTNIEAETINLDGDKIIKTPIDKTQIYLNKINNNFSEIVFTLPNVKAGSVIEVKYNTYPERTWNFQGGLPTRFSEVKIHWKGVAFAGLGGQMSIRQPLFKDSTDEKNGTRTFALKNIHSLPDEPFMTARRDNLQRIKFETIGLYSTTWNTIASRLANTDIYNFPQDVVLPGQEGIINKANELLNDEGRIAFLFDTVKNLMKWDGKIVPVPATGLKDAWKKKTGNSAEINLILLHFLRELGFKALPTLVATKNFGTILPLEPDIYSVNNTIVTIPTDSAKYYYALDASDKYNLYNEVPLNILNTYAERIDLDKRSAASIALEKNNPAAQLTAIDAHVQSDGKMIGKASVTSNSYHKSEALSRFGKFDQKTYLDSVFQIGNNIKVNSFKIENVKDNKEPLLQEISFTCDLNNGASDGYLYFNTNLFSPIGDNPFKNEQRFSDIDLRFGSDYGMTGVYRIPNGYKIDALPKSITILMPDKSIMFKRTAAQDNDAILVRYSISHRRSIYTSEEYQSLRGFYKEMYELLNEQIILKKE